MMIPSGKQHGSNFRLPDGWESCQLGDVAQLNPRRPADLARDNDAPTTFVPMAAVDETLGTITRPETRPFAEVKKGYTCFAEGDVLFAKITPCLQNGKHAIARDLTDGVGFGSTEFHVLRPGPCVIAEWIHFYLLSSTAKRTPSRNGSLHRRCGAAEGARLLPRKSRNTAPALARATADQRHRAGATGRGRAGTSGGGKGTKHHQRSSCGDSSPRVEWRHLKCENLKSPI